jgi:hypothetical protein
MPKSPDTTQNNNALDDFDSDRSSPTLPSDWELGQSPGFDVPPDNQSKDLSFDFGDFENPSPSFSLDDFDSAPNPGLGTGAEETVHDRTHDSEEDAEGGNQTDGEKQARKKRLKILVTCAAVSIAVVSAIAVPVYRSMKPKSLPLVGHKMIRQTIAVPEYPEEFEFLVLASSEKDRNLLSIRLEFVFAASNAHETFCRQASYFRETVYQYLMRARPAKNSQKLWQSILEDQLMAYMKENFPRSGLQTIRVAHWERL